NCTPLMPVEIHGIPVIRLTVTGKKGSPFVPEIFPYKSEGLSPDAKILIFLLDIQGKQVRRFSPAEVQITNRLFPADDEKHRIIRAQNPLDVFLGVPGYIEVLQHLVGVNAPIGGLPYLLPQPGNQNSVLCPGRAKLQFTWIHFPHSFEKHYTIPNSFFNRFPPGAKEANL